MISRNFIVMSLLFLSYAAPSFAEGEQLRDTNGIRRVAAVFLEADGPGISQSELFQFKSRIRTEFDRLENFSVISQITSAQRARYRERFPRPCRSTECAVEVGRILNADFVVSGSIGHVGRTYTVKLRFVSVAEERVLNEISMRDSGAFEQILERVIPIAIERLTNISPPPSGAIAVLKLKVVGAGISAVEMSEFATRLRTELGAREQFSAVGLPTQVQLTQYREQSLQSCNTIECITAAGRILSADVVATGKVSRVRKRYIIELCLVSVEERRVVSVVKMRGKWSFGQLLEKVTPLAAAQLAGMSRREVETLAASEGVIFDIEKKTEYAAIGRTTAIVVLIGGTLALIAVALLITIGFTGGYGPN
jgi:hypothetical protein